MSTQKTTSQYKPIIITPASALELPDFRELWEYRGLLYFLIRRDILVRFQQTVIGFLWIVIQPLILMLIFNMVFGVLVKVPTNGIPFPLFFLSAFIVWQFFTQVINSSAQSLVGNINVIIKSYFPRLALPLSSVASALVDFGISFLVLMVFLLMDGHFPITIRYALLPVLLVLTTLFASGVGLLFGALTVVFRDMKNLLTFILMIWMYLTPIMYPISLVPEKFRLYFYFNPLTGLLDAYRWVFFKLGSLPRIEYLLVSTFAALAIWLLGAVVFRSMENKIADVM